MNLILKDIQKDTGKGKSLRRVPHGSENYRME